MANPKLTRRPRGINSLIACCMISMLFVGSGCSTLSSLGIPVGSSSNKLLKSAKSISEAPQQSLLIPKELAIAPLAQYVIEISDTVSIEPVSFDADIRLPGDQVVKPDGTISLGEFGLFLAIGKTVDQIQLEIQAQIDAQIRSRMEIEFAKKEAQEQRRLAEDNLAPELEFESDFASDDDDEDEATVDSEESEEMKRQREVRIARREFERDVDRRLSQNRISARLTNWDSKKIYVLGEVNSPGSFRYLGNETVLDAIIEAGGIGSKANHHSIIVSRPSSCGDCRTVMKVCYDQIVQLGDASTNYQLLPGDRVYVPSLSFIEDVKQTLNPSANDKCPRCSCEAVGCNLPQGCE